MRAPRRTLLPALLTALAVTAVAGPAAAAPASNPDGTAIYQHWQDLGGDLGNLGPAISPDLPTPFRPGAYQVFNAGSIYWSAATGAWDVHGLIRDDWASLGYENSALGFPTSDENQLAGSAVFQTFEGGLAYYAPGVGAHEVRGAILGEYAALGYENSALGFPITNELTAPDGTGRFEVFEHGSIYWSPSTGAHEISGDILAKWGAIGYERSILGYPTTDEVAVPGGRKTDFLLGTITDTDAGGPLVTRFFAPVSSVDRRGSNFTVQLLQQTFRYDANDTFERLPLGGTVTTLPTPVPLTKKQFTDALGVDTFVLAQNYSLDPKATTTYEIVDIASVPKTIEGRSRLLHAQR